MSIKVISGHNVFNENAVVLSQKNKWTLEKEFNPQANDLYIVFGAHELAHQLLEIQYRKNSSFGYIILNSEQIHSQFFKNKYYIQLMKRNVVCDYNTLTCDYLRQNFDIKVFSYYHFEFMKFPEEQQRIYDVCFIGTKNQHREETLNKLQEQFPNLKFYIDLEWKHSSSDSLTKILSQCKVVLNMPFYQDNALETHRINKALACGCQVVSTFSKDKDADEFYKDYIYFSDDLERGIIYQQESKVPKKSYEDLVKALNQKITPHFLFVITQVHKKLISLSNTNDVLPQDSTLSESTSSNRDKDACENTNDEVGK
jgi:hypothetical protein